MTTAGVLKLFHDFLKHITWLVLKENIFIFKWSYYMRYTNRVVKMVPLIITLLRHVTSREGYSSGQQAAFVSFYK